MSRVIKFRAYEKDSGEMFFPSTDNNNEMFFSGLYEGHVKVATSLYSDEEDYVIMQFTGLHDKNSVEIYEGDVVSGFRQGNWHGGIDKVKGVVKYREQIVGYTIDSSGSKALYNGGKLHDVEELEVIGNIHQHPHLLEGS